MRRSKRVQLMAVVSTGLFGVGIPVPSAAQSNFVCQSPAIWRGSKQNDHRGYDLSVGNWDGAEVPETALPDILAGGASPLDTTMPAASIGSVALHLGGPYVPGNPYGGQCRIQEDVRIEGELVGDRFGWSVAFVGNLELTPQAPETEPSLVQLRDDFVVGAPHGPFDINTGWTDQGQVYVFLSGIFMPDPYEPSNPETLYDGTNASLIIVDPIPEHRFGYSVCAVGDFDGDGWPDFAVGAPGMLQEQVQTFGGEVSVISGRLVEQAALSAAGPSPGPLRVFIDDVICHWPGTSDPIYWPGDAPGDKLGVDVALAGDLGPGFAHQGMLVAGAPQWLYNSSLGGPPDVYQTTGHGYVKLFSRDQASSPIKITYEDADPLVQVGGSTGPPGGGPSNPLAQPDPVNTPDGVWFGQSVTGGLDINGNGYGEIVVGGPKWDYLDSDPQFNARDTGKSFVVEPFTPLVLPMTYRTDVGIQVEENFGWSVASIGDFDGDGTGDFGVSSRLYTAAEVAGACGTCPEDNELNSGGRGCGSATVVTSPSVQPVRFTGENGRDSFGWAMVCVGDVDGDSKDEFVACSFRWGLQPEDKEEGRLYVVETEVITP